MAGVLPDGHDPDATGASSLNVAVAAGILVYHFRPPAAKPD